MNEKFQKIREEILKELNEMDELIYRNVKSKIQNELLRKISYIKYNILDEE